MLTKAIFFDRDGTLNVEKNFLIDPKDFEWIPGAIDSIRFCNENDFLAIVVTNQSGIARGYFTESDVENLHQWMNSESTRESMIFSIVRIIQMQTSKNIGSIAIVENLNRD